MFHAWVAIDSSLSVVFHKHRFPIVPQWTPLTLTACLTPTECLEASDSWDLGAGNRSAKRPARRWHDPHDRERWVFWERGDTALEVSRVASRTGEVPAPRPAACAFPRFTQRSRSAGRMIQVSRKHSAAGARCACALAAARGPRRRRRRGMTGLSPRTSRGRRRRPSGHGRE